MRFSAIACNMMSIQNFKLIVCALDVVAHFGSFYQCMPYIASPFSPLRLTKHLEKLVDESNHSKIGFDSMESSDIKLQNVCSVYLPSEQFIYTILFMVSSGNSDDSTFNIIIIPLKWNMLLIIYYWCDLFTWPPNVIISFHWQYSTISPFSSLHLFIFVRISSKYCSLPHVQWVTASRRSINCVQRWRFYSILNTSKIILLWSLWLGSVRSVYVYCVYVCNIKITCLS